MKNNSMKVHQNKVEPWNVTLIDTGQTMTGGRLHVLEIILKMRLRSALPMVTV